MIWLPAIPAILLIAAALYRRPGKAWRRGYVERVPLGRGRLPMPEPSAGERVEGWRIAYGRLTLEQQLDPGAWPFSASAVHSLPRRMQTDPRELLQ